MNRLISVIQIFKCIQLYIRLPRDKLILYNRISRLFDNDPATRRVSERMRRDCQCRWCCGWLYCRTCGGLRRCARERWRRSPRRRRGRGERRRTPSSPSSVGCCRCRPPSPASSTKPPSSGSQPATSRWERSSPKVTDTIIILLLLISLCKSTYFRTSSYTPIGRGISRGPLSICLYN